MAPKKSIPSPRVPGPLFQQQSVYINNWCISAPLTMKLEAKKKYSFRALHEHLFFLNAQCKYFWPAVRNSGGFTRPAKGPVQFTLTRFQSFIDSY